MLNTIMSFVTDQRANKVGARFSENFVSQVDDKITRLVKANTNSTSSVSSKGIEYIATILRMADVGYYRKFLSDVDRYVKIEKELPLFYNINSWLSNTFSVAQGGHITDIVLPVKSQLDIKRIPVDNDNWEAWSKLRPFRMVCADTTELSMWNHTGRILYRNSPPLAITYTLDVPLVLLMYCKYLDTHENVDMYKFVFDICTAPILHDAYKCWNMDLIGIYSMFVALDEDTDPDINLITVDTVGKDVVRKGECYQYHNDLIKILKMVSKGSITPVQAMCSIYISKDETLFDYCRKFQLRNRPIGQGSHFLWQSICSELWVKKTVLSLYSLQNNRASTNEVKKSLLRIFRRYQRIRFEQNIKHLSGREYIKATFDEIFEMLD